MTILPPEYLRAIHNPSYRDVVQKTIVRHPSDWYHKKEDSIWQAFLKSLKKQAPDWEEYSEAFIEKMAWMQEVTTEKLGPSLWHMHPVMFLGVLRDHSNSVKCSLCRKNITITAELLIYCYGISADKASLYTPLLTNSFIKYEINNCLRISHFLGQVGVETKMLKELKEGFYYKDGDRLWKIYYTQLNICLTKRFPSYTEAQRKQYTKEHLVRNEDELAKTLFPSEYEGMDYRGRGLIHLTHEGTYKKYKEFSGDDVLSNPKLLEQDPAIAVDSACWFWSKFTNVNTLADGDKLDLLTYRINTAKLDIATRGKIKKLAFDYIKKNNMGCKK